jgi:hypothetical protein
VTGPQDGEGTEVHAVAVFDAALEAAKGFESVLVGVADGRIVVWAGRSIRHGEVLVEAFDLVGPQLGLNAAEAALGPLGGNEGIDGRELVGVGGAVVEEECGGEGFEFRRGGTPSEPWAARPYTATGA